MKKKRIFSITLCILIPLILVWQCEEFFRREIGGFAGSYPFVETWTLNVPEGELIGIIHDVKVEHPELKPKTDTSEGRSSYWYFIDFYYPDTKETVHTWVRSGYDSVSTTTFALIGFSKGNEYFRYINKDYWYVANKMEISKFEREIVNRIKDKIQR